MSSVDHSLDLCLCFSYYEISPHFLYSSCIRVAHTLFNKRVVSSSWRERCGKQPVARPGGVTRQLVPQPLSRRQRARCIPYTTGVLFQSGRSYLLAEPKHTSPVYITKTIPVGHALFFVWWWWYLFCGNANCSSEGCSRQRVQRDFCFLERRPNFKWKENWQKKTGPTNRFSFIQPPIRE